MQRKDDDVSSLRRAVLVLGMHRSGTSALTRVINLMGFTAPRTLMPATEANEEGFWESQVFMDLNEEILAACGSKWNDWRPFKVDPLATARANGLYGKVREAIAGEYGGAAHIVLKDPRISRLVPLYAAALGEEGYRIQPVIALRNPMEVAASLTRRHGLTQSRGIGSWLRYTLDAEAATRGRPRAVISYDGLLEDWRGTLERAAIHLGEPFPPLTPEAIAETDAALRPRLRHHMLPPPGGLDWRRFLAGRAYGAMGRLAADPQDPAARRTLDRVSAVFRWG